MSSQRTSADDSGFETPEQTPVISNNNEARESHVHEERTIEELTNGSATNDPATENAKTNSVAATKEDMKDSPIDDNTPTKPPIIKKSRKRKAGAETPQEDTPTKKQKTTISGIRGAPDLDLVDATTAKQPAAKKPRKRKAADDTGTEDTPQKRQRKQTAKAADAATSPPKERKTRNSRKTEDDSLAMAPPPLPPMQVTSEVAAKIQQVHEFIRTYPAETFERQPILPRSVTLPERNLEGILSIMYSHWELKVPAEGVLSEFQDAIVHRSDERVGTACVPAPMVTVDIAVLTRLEEKIHKKILRHGLEGKSLLYVEIRMFDKNLQARSALFRSEVGRLLDAVADCDEDAETAQVNGVEEASSPLSSPLTIDGEDTWLGVCPPPMQKV